LNPPHLIVEAEDSQSLSRGMQGLCIRLAKTLNRFLRRSGGVFADHYHSVLLRTPTELVNRIAYVLSNAVRHYGETEDACSSLEHGEVLQMPRGWLLRAGFMRGRRPKAPRAVEALRRWAIARERREMA
jgi:putative transposase